MGQSDCPLVPKGVNMQINRITSPEITQIEIDHMNLSRKLAGECMVLLENDGTLPLAKGAKIALFGNGARNTVKGGTGSGDVNTRTNVNIEQGLKEAGFEITTGAWIDRYDAAIKAAKAAHAAMIEENVKKNGSSYIMESFLNPFVEPAVIPVTEEDVRNAGCDTAIYVISRNSGEGADRWAKEGDYYLSTEDKEALGVLVKGFDKVVVILNIGGVMDMAELKGMDGINAVLLMTQLGNIGGLALADVLTGDVTPSGKLTDTWAAKYEDYPSSGTFSHNNGDVHDDDYCEGIYVGYRYFDTKGIAPVYPFGYGRSYTEFSVVPGKVCIEGQKVNVSAEVKNIGSVFSGKEVVQVYVSAPKGSLDKPVKELKAFAKSGLLAPGASECVCAQFDLTDMASYSEEKAAWILEAGEYVVLVGNSSAD
ncbi:MAG: glycoside hydrolase family 3 C-terminal domain-containing protein, partial [Lachnospiraceae bacterium]|nr:glycoside hydrolase family 3 C-terminal domain-containing protein [Lachnospiraceae bacterium]